MEQVRTGVELLAKIADCLIKETESWTANIQALLKAKVMEEKAQKAADKKAEKAEEREIEKQRKKDAALKAKIAKEAKATCRGEKHE